MEKLADIDVAHREFHIGQRLMHTPEFRTATGRALFQVRDLPDTPADETHDVRLTTVRSEGQFNSIIYEEKDSYRKTDTRWCVMLNESDIEGLGIEPGERISLESAHGRMDNVKVFVHDLPRGNAMAYYPEANCLTGTEVDPRSKTPSFKHTRVRLLTSTA